MFTLGMPYAMMQSNDVNLANALTGERIFDHWTLAPRLELIKEACNERVMPLIGDMLTMDYEEPQPQDAAFDVYAASMGWLTGILTQNQAAEAMGYPALGPEGDRRIYEITGTAPTMPPTPAPPRKPTQLSYRQRKDAQEVAGEAEALTNSWKPRLADLREQYLAFAGNRNGVR